MSWYNDGHLAKGEDTAEKISDFQVGVKPTTLVILPVTFYHSFVYNVEWKSHCRDCNVGGSQLSNQAHQEFLKCNGYSSGPALQRP